jgi:hypothetical protein
MSARTPRRSFLSPFVVTIASAPACFYQSSTPPSQQVTQPAPGQPEQADPNPTPPPPETQTPTIISNPPRPTTPPGNPPAPTENPAPPPIPEGNDGEWIVTKSSRGCEARAITHCPPKAMCNPPPPHTYACVDGASYPAKVTKKAEVCTLESSHTVPCPK